MAEITAAAVKELRERTGAGMMDCKRALHETGGDMEAAIDWLRTKGLAAAAKKAGRTAAEGLVGVAVIGTIGAAVEVNSETDFVAKNERFQEFVRNVAQIALATGGDVDELARAQYPGHGTVAEMLTHNIATIGENIRYFRSEEEGAAGSLIVHREDDEARENMTDLMFRQEYLAEIVSFTVPANVRSRRVMERLGMHRDPADDFDHPRLPPGHPLRRLHG